MYVIDYHLPKFLERVLYAFDFSQIGQSCTRYSHLYSIVRHGLEIERPRFLDSEAEIKHSICFSIFWRKILNSPVGMFGVAADQVSREVGRECIGKR